MFDIHFNTKWKIGISQSGIGKELFFNFQNGQEH